MIDTQPIQQRIEDILPQLETRELELILAFTELVRNRAIERREDEVLWSFVERELAYRAEHPEDVMDYDSEEELLAALNTAS